ncbi:MAG TPA: hypothetical protein VHB50_20585 [Bryobacteraceae bacterium]|nr:hypothetical protein [Bryobacteraceae bacterium]
MARLISWLVIRKNAANRARAVAPFARVAQSRLVRDHALQYGLIGLVGDYRLVQLVLPFARLGREDVASKRMRPHNLSRPGLFKPFRRTFVGLQFWHGNIRETKSLA